MKAPNHIVGGYVFTGLVSSLLGWNVFESVGLLIITFIGVLIPDVDHPKSLFGRAFFPIAKLINRRYGHRTITHSVFFLVASSVVVGLINSLMGIDHLAATYFIAVFSHLLFDMMTISGVVFFYPMSKHVFVMPGKEDLRLSSNNVRAESIVMIVFLLLGFALLPLFRQGFWTTYNKSFSTLTHLHSEFVKSDDMLFADVVVRSGTDIDTIRGYVILSTDNTVSLFDDDSYTFNTVPSKYQTIISLSFNHTSDYTFSFAADPQQFPISIMIDDDLYCNIRSNNI